jgi:replication factor C subunit 3/5
MNEETNTVFVEKYRPKNLDSIVLDPLNKKIFENIIDLSYFPNLLFYGPPGTGKTTSIINLVNAYQEKENKINKSLMIHLNASDERGIDIIRNQINSFVNSKGLFNEGMKFIILDEVDYMTKNAQQALRYLLQNYSNSVRFCLICNYISRIDEGLQNEFIRLRFNQLPEEEIIDFLENISKSENLGLDKENLKLIQKLYKSDVRSMINFMQSNQNLINKDLNILNDDVWKDLYKKLEKREKIENYKMEIEDISIKYNIDKKNIIKEFLNYIIRTNKEIVTEEFLEFVENIMHYHECSNNNYLNYSLVKLLHFI